jgi:hypothetical protein
MIHPVSLLPLVMHSTNIVHTEVIHIKTLFLKLTVHSCLGERYSQLRSQHWLNYFENLGRPKYILQNIFGQLRIVKDTFGL